MNDKRKAILQIITVATAVTLGLIIVDLYEGRPIETMIIGNSFVFGIGIMIGVFIKRKEIFSN